jgi:hypothetical protein
MDMRSPVDLPQNISPPLAEQDNSKVCHDIPDKKTGLTNYQKRFYFVNEVFYNSHPYNILDRSNREIRLIGVNAGSEDDGIECTIYDNQSLDNVRDRYIALSYRAGDEKTPISVDGQTFEVFANLACALRRARTLFSGKSIWVWADQICIDQSDEEEKAHQVAQMYDIYENAGLVLVWLGGEHKDDTGMSLLLEMFDSARQNFLEAGQEHGDGLQSVDLHLRKTLPKEYITKLEKKDMRDQWASLLDILASPWWSRCWVVQELIASRNAAMLYGTKHLMSHAVFKALRVVQVIEAMLCEDLVMGIMSTDEDIRWMAPLLSRDDSVHFFEEVAKNWKGKSGDIKLLLKHARSCGASDPRDRVYAFISMADPRYGFSPNYDELNSVEDVFIDAAKRIMKYDRNLNLLSFVQFEKRSTSNTLPSWVPD